MYVSIPNKVQMWRLFDYFIFSVSFSGGFQSLSERRARSTHFPLVVKSARVFRDRISEQLITFFYLSIKLFCQKLLDFVVRFYEARIKRTLSIVIENKK